MADVTISDVMAAYAKDAELDATRRGFALDYSEDSLSIVDEILGGLTQNGLITPANDDEKERWWNFSKMYGAYVGEVVIRNLHGTWEMKDNEDGSARVVLLWQQITGFPLEKIYKRLTEDEFSGVAGYCRALRAIVAQRHPAVE
jgi:hypothetical protein